jgi:hypothetical protein
VLEFAGVAVIDSGCRRLIHETRRRSLRTFVRCASNDPDDASDGDHDRDRDRDAGGSAVHPTDGIRWVRQRETRANGRDDGRAWPREVAW